MLCLNHAGLGATFVAPVAKKVAMIESSQVESNQIELLLAARVQVTKAPYFEPFLRWQGRRYFPRAGAMLLHDPWVSPPFSFTTKEQLLN